MNITRLTVLDYLFLSVLTLLISQPSLCTGGDELPPSYTPRIMKVGIAPDFLTLPPESDQAVFDECIVDETIAEFLHQYGPSEVRRSFPGFDPNDYPEYDHIPPLDRFYTIHFRSFFDIPEASERFCQLKGVLFAQPSYYIPHQETEKSVTPPRAVAEKMNGLNKTAPPFTPNDPVFYGNPQLLPHQWNLHDDGAGIGCQTAWAISTGDPNIRIGNMDFGIWHGHDDLNISGGFFVAPSGVGSGYYSAPAQQLEVEKNEHATLSAGILAASSNNNYAIAGIAGGNNSIPGCSLYDIQLSADDLSSEALSAWKFALMAAVDPLDIYLCDVVSMSISYGEADEDFRGAVRFANEVGASVVTGNGRRSGTRYPALLDNHWVTAVGAHDSSGMVIYNSGRSAEIDLVAPSTCISTVVPIKKDPVFGDMYLNYHAFSSCATPHVAGSIALLRSFLGNNLNPEDYENIIKLSSNDSTTSDGNAQTWADSCGHGRLDIGKALSNAAQQSIVSFSSANTNISDPEYVDISFISGPYAGLNSAIRYKVSGWISFSNTFSDVPIAWGRCEPAYAFGFHGLSKYSPNYGEPFHGVEENSVTKFGCTAYTYVYKLADNNGKYVNWYPAHFSQIPVTVKAMGPTTSQKSICLAVTKVKLSTAPNPFNAQVNISFQIDNPDRVVVDIVDLRGNRICNLLDQECDAGTITTPWTGTDQNGNGVASGTYFVRVTKGGNVAVQKISLAK